MVINRFENNFFVDKGVNIFIIEDMYMIYEMW